MRKIKRYILKKLGIIRLREQLDNEQIKIKELEKRNKQLMNVNLEMMHRINDLEKLALMHWGSLNESERTPRIIVSLTSFPARIEHVTEVLKRMLIQTVKPDEVVLWLSKEQFPERELELPNRLLEMKKYGVKIEWCDGDMKAYKKFLPALKRYPDDLIIIIDDDLIYPVDLVERLYHTHKCFPKAIIASRVHEIGIDKDGKIAPYGTWKKQCGHDTNVVKQDWFFTGGAGTLLPPHIFGEEMFETDVILDLCPWADDIWLNINAAMQKVPIINVAANNILTRIDGTQEICLQKINIEKNDIQLKNVITHYREKLIGTVYENI